MARFDSVGMFWSDVESSEKGRATYQRPMPPIPETGWEPPRNFPNLDAARVLSVDTETWDPELDKCGPGWGRGKGHIVGVSVGADEGGRWYFPIRHTIEPHHNLQAEHVFAWLRDTMSNPRQPKVGANLLYDYGWLLWEGVELRGELVDVQFAEALLDERARVGLDVLGHKYLGEGKDTSLLYQWCADFYGGTATSDQRKNIWRAPPKLVGPYAEADADLPLRVAVAQYPHLAQEGLLDLFRMECDLIPLLVRMRLAGVSVNMPKVAEVRTQLVEKRNVAIGRLSKLAGFNVNVNAGEHLARLFNKEGVPFNKTPTGKPSFTKAFLEGLEHPVGELIRDVRKYDKIIGTFIDSYIVGSHVDGKIHCSFHPLRGDSGGTRSGRFSSSDPNLQNIPSRDDELAPLVRGLYVPDDGHITWRKYDYSQIEYRFLIHFALGQGAEEARGLFNSHPDTDYHEMTLDLVAPAAGWDVSTKDLRKKWRKPVKNINFGLIYGMGVDKLAYDLGLSRAEGKALFAAYHKGVPFAKATMDAAASEAQRTGVIRTILNRKSRFDLWEPLQWNAETVPMSYDRALVTYGRIRRAHTHKALNRRLQGSAADLMKRAMWQCWKDGIFDATGVPRLTVHDELDFSDPGGNDKAFAEMHRVLETALSLLIPVKAELEIGYDWGHVMDPNKWASKVV